MASTYRCSRKCDTRRRDNRVGALTRCNELATMIEVCGRKRSLKLFIIEARPTKCGSFQRFPRRNK